MALFDIARNGHKTCGRWTPRNVGALGGQNLIQDWEEQSGLPLVANGFLDGSRICAAAGNAVVPQIPELIGRAIMEAEGMK
jgi:hypothetical protein